MAASKEKALPIFRIDLIEDDGDWSDLPNPEAVIEGAAAAVAHVAPERLRSGVISVALSSDEQVRALNETFLGKANPTNVLSFPPGDGAPTGFLGDIVMAQETVAREAAEQGVPLEHHVQHLVVHGILHLLGYDHTDAPDAERMEALEVAILSDLGVANPYTGALETGKSE